ncbi:MAG: hypothetical protein COB50_03895 [Thiotrichales bacterium]|nr:MAG: hypothetical protein COB50_03895 [Thiotrichales bacterium]
MNKKDIAKYAWEILEYRFIQEDLQVQTGEQYIKLKIAEEYLNIIIDNNKPRSEYLIKYLENEEGWNSEETSITAFPKLLDETITEMNDFLNANKNYTTIDYTNAYKADGLSELRQKTGAELQSLCEIERTKTGAMLKKFSTDVAKLETIINTKKISLPSQEAQRDLAKQHTEILISKTVALETIANELISICGNHKELDLIKTQIALAAIPLGDNIDAINNAVTTIIAAGQALKNRIEKIQPHGMKKILASIAHILLRLKRMFLRNTVVKKPIKYKVMKEKIAKSSQKARILFSSSRKISKQKKSQAVPRNNDDLKI